MCATRYSIHSNYHELPQAKMHNVWGCSLFMGLGGGGWVQVPQ